MVPVAVSRNWPPDEKLVPFQYFSVESEMTPTRTDATPLGSVAVPQIPGPAAQPAFQVPVPYVCELAGNVPEIVGPDVSTVQVRVVAELVVFLASAKARHIQGTSVTVDGGGTPGYY